MPNQLRPPKPAEDMTISPWLSELPEHSALSKHCRGSIDTLMGMGEEERSLHRGAVTSVLELIGEPGVPPRHAAADKRWLALRDLERACVYEELELCYSSSVYAILASAAHPATVVGASD